MNGLSFSLIMSPAKFQRYARLWEGNSKVPRMFTAVAKPRSLRCRSLVSRLGASFQEH